MLNFFWVFLIIINFRIQLGKRECGNALAFAKCHQKFESAICYGKFVEFLIFFFVGERKRNERFKISKGQKQGTKIMILLSLKENGLESM